MSVIRDEEPLRVNESDSATSFDSSELEEDSSLDSDEDFFKEKPTSEMKAKVSVAKKITHDSVFKEVTIM